jgi:Ion channel
LFWLLHQLSPSRLVRRSRGAHVSSQAFHDDPHGSTVRRSRRVEGYIIAWFLIELMLVGSSALEVGWPMWIPRVLAIIRILDIFQSAVNMSVFDQLRTDEHLVISSAVRTLVLSFLNYVELGVCFGLLYTTLTGSLIGSAGWMDDLYFSAVTQLTIGYGDIRPVGWARLVSVIQGLVSVAFTVLMLGRIVGVLPRIVTVMKHTRDE